MVSTVAIPRNRRRAFARLVAAFAILLSGVLVSPLGAHTEVFERAPIAGVPVGGVVDQVNISFWSNVLTSNITVTGPDGQAIDVATTQLVSENRIATTTFPELTEPGRYVVNHTELSPDGDIQSAEFFFVFDPTSDNRLIPVAPAVIGDSGPNWVLIVGAAGVILILAGVLWPKKTSVAV